MNELVADSAEFFETNGYMIRRGLVSARQLDAIQAAACRLQQQGLAPAEYEADVQYPGAPDSRDAEGGQTVRRFLQVVDREAAFREFATGGSVRSALERILGNDLYLVRSHHNSLMTKQPRFSSQTNWHRDIRYWHYDHEDLVSAWLALGEETRENGALMLIPGSHRIEFERGNFDEALFFRQDLPENRALIESAVMAELAPGDVLFFHCRTLHAASRNHGSETKRSLVFTYRPASTLPVAGTRSSEQADLRL